jgi:hypothetical protein
MFLYFNDIDANIIKRVNFETNSLDVIAELPVSARVAEASLLDNDHVLVRSFSYPSFALVGS